MKLYQVDAFTNQLFSGNPAGVCPLDEWLPDEVMQNIAAENNLAETAFFVPKGSRFELRWFTPTIEVALCGHATLAAAHVLWQHLGYEGEEIHFDSRFSGSLSVIKDGELMTLDFPMDDIHETDIPAVLIPALGGAIPEDLYKGKTDYLLIFETQEEIENIQPNFQELIGIDARGIIVSAPGNDVDFVSRFFAPQVGVDEDPVTGSAHTSLIPYWSKRLGETENLTARQLSKRGGNLVCALKENRVLISGEAKTYLIGEIFC